MNSEWLPVRQPEVFQKQKYKSRNYKKKEVESRTPALPKGNGVKNPPGYYTVRDSMYGLLKVLAKCFFHK